MSKPNDIHKIRKIIEVRKRSRKSEISKFSMTNWIRNITKASEISKIIDIRKISKIKEMRRRSLTSEISKFRKSNGIRNISKSSEISQISWTNEIT